MLSLHDAEKLIITKPDMSHNGVEIRLSWSQTMLGEAFPLAVS